MCACVCVCVYNICVSEWGGGKRMRPRMGNALQAFGGSEEPEFRFLLLLLLLLRALAWAGLGWAFWSAVSFFDFSLLRRGDLRYTTIIFMIFMIFLPKTLLLHFFFHFFCFISHKSINKVNFLAIFSQKHRACFFFLQKHYWFYDVPPSLTFLQI